MQCFTHMDLTVVSYCLDRTLLFAALCMPIVQYETLGHLSTGYPGLHLTTLAAILARNLYRSRRLSQWPGFSWLGGP